MKEIALPNQIKDAWVVFTGRTEIPWLSILKPGFRHCFVVLCDGKRWISYDPLSNHTDIAVHDYLPADFDLPLWLMDRGHSVIHAELCREHMKPAPWMFYTCVEAVKRFLGLHNRFIVTPWQLYCHLQFQSQQSKGENSWVV